jgi:hypothetical protein
MSYLKRGAAILLAAACQAPSWAVPTLEVLTNPGFDQVGIGYAPTDCLLYKLEDGVTPMFPNHPQLSGYIGAGWESNNCWMPKPNTHVAFSVVTGGRNASSVQSQYVQTDGAQGDVMIQSSQITMIPGRRYTTAIWVKAAQASEVLVQLREEGGLGAAYGMMVKKLAQNTWTEVRFDGIAPTVASAARIYVLPQGPGGYWLDDASVVSDTDSTPALVNRASAAISSTYFGVHVHAAPNWPLAGSAIGSIRLWDGGGIPKLQANGSYLPLTKDQGINWISVYPTDPAAGGTPHWIDLDDRLLQAKQNNAETLMVLGGAIPAWASSHSEGTFDSFCDGYYDGNIPTGGSGAPPKDDNNDKIWKDWVTAIATHAKSLKDQGKGSIRYWEVWNEPYQCKYFTNNPTRLATLVAEARAILKSIDSTNVVISPSFDLGDNTFLDRYLQAAQAAYPNGEAYGDNWAFHYYDFALGKYLDHRPGSDTKDKDAAHRKSVETALYQDHLILNTKMVLARFGVQNRPIWNTEGGYMGNGAATATGQPNDAEGAPFIARNYLMEWVAGIDRNFYYAWDQRQGSGDLDPAIHSWPVVGAREMPLGSANYQFVTTAAGVAYGQVSKWLSGATLENSTTAFDPATGTWVFKLRRGPALSTIVWNSNGPTSYPHLTGLTRQTNLAGVVSTVGANVTVSDPVLLSAPATSVSMSSSNVAVWQGWNAKVTLTAAVYDGYAPTGYVQFQLDGVNLGAPVALSGVQAVLQTTDIDNATVANHTLTAVYLGDSVNPVNSTSTGLNIKVCTAAGVCP